LSAIGQIDEAISLIDESVVQVETNGNLLYIPELLRVKGTILLLLPEPNRNNAEACFLQALELSRNQGARAWELRAAIDLARLREAIDEAHELLRPVFEHFVEGLGTTDLKAADGLLATLPLDVMSVPQPPHLDLCTRGDGREAGAPLTIG
jgi:predicted ATPase